MAYFCVWYLLLPECHTSGAQVGCRNGGNVRMSLANAQKPKQAASDPIVLGRPAGFMLPGSDPKRYGLRELFFEPSENTLIFAGGASCGHVARAVAVEFVCGDTLELRRVAEVRTCCYVAEVSHPGACNLLRWPRGLRDLDTTSLEASTAEVSAWLLRNAQRLHQEGVADWTARLGSARSSQQWLQRVEQGMVPTPGDRRGCVGVTFIRPILGGISSGASGECSKKLCPGRGCRAEISS